MTPTYIAPELRRQVAQDAGHRCGYCHSDESLTGISLTMDHIIPVAAGGQTERDNLWLACRACNEFKGARTHADDPKTGERARLFDPRRQTWSEHFVWSTDQTEVVGLTSTGRATAIALQLNRPMLVKARRRWVMSGWQPTPE